jgi:hypothetical protein
MEQILTSVNPKTPDREKGHLPALEQFTETSGTRTQPLKYSGGSEPAPNLVSALDPTHPLKP